MDTIVACVLLICVAVAADLEHDCRVDPGAPDNVKPDHYTKERNPEYKYYSSDPESIAKGKFLLPIRSHRLASVTMLLDPSTLLCRNKRRRAVS